MTKLEALTALRDKAKAAEIKPYAQAEFVGAIDGEYSHVRARDAYNGSLDAAKALHDAVLPEWGWLLGSENEASVFYGENGKRFDATSDNPARAWLLAILEALIAQEQA